LGILAITFSISTAEGCGEVDSAGVLPEATPVDRSSSVGLELTDLDSVSSRLVAASLDLAVDSQIPRHVPTAIPAASTGVERRM